MSLLKGRSDPGATAAYDEDLYVWTAAPAGVLRQLQPGGLDRENIAEEIESFNNEQISALESFHTLLIFDLLQCQYQPRWSGRFWQLTIQNSRNQIARREKRNPSLRARARDRSRYLSGCGRQRRNRNRPFRSRPSPTPAPIQ